MFLVREAQVGKMKFRLALIVLVMTTLACSISVANSTTVYNVPASSIPTVMTVMTTTPTPQATPITAWVTADKAVHVRDQASEHGLHVRYLYRNDLVSVYECKVTPGPGLWARIDRGWVNARYLSKNACN